MAKKKPALEKALTKSQLLSEIAEDTGVTKKEVASVLEALSEQISRHLKKKGPGAFTLPGLAKFSAVAKAARKARKGINPFTGEEIMIKAKPASRAVKIRPLKGLKDSI